jgi:hypothetical protein
MLQALSLLKNRTSDDVVCHVCSTQIGMIVAVLLSIPVSEQMQW